MHNQFLPALLLYDDIEGGRSFTLKNALLRMATPRLLVTEGHGLDAADEIGERRVDQQVAERVTVSGGDKLHAKFGDGASGSRFQFGANFINNDDLGHMIFDGLNH